MPVSRQRFGWRGSAAAGVAGILALVLLILGCGTPISDGSTSSPRPLRTYESQAFGFRITYDDSMYRVGTEKGGGEVPSGGSPNPEAFLLDLVSSGRGSVTVQAVAFPDSPAVSVVGAWGEDDARLSQRKSLYLPPQLGFESTARWGRLNGMRSAIYEGENQRVHQLIYEILDTNTVDRDGDERTVEYVLILSSDADDWPAVAEVLQDMAGTFTMLGGSPGHDE